jgi:hypothetical protein
VLPWAMFPAVNNSGKQRGRPFKKGQSGNARGRPKGSRNRRTRALLDGVEARGGERPLDVLLDAMDWFHSQARSLCDTAPLEDPTAELARHERIGELFLSAATIARAAAPYVHARLSPIEGIGRALQEKVVVTLKIDDDLPLIHRSKADEEGSSGTADPTGIAQF